MLNTKESELDMRDYRKQILQEFLEIQGSPFEIINNWRRGPQKILTKINTNGVNDILTEVDQKIEELAVTFIQRIVPDARVFGEENFKHDFSITRLPIYFVIDPIDGTKEFVRGSSEWSISLCLVENSEPTVALISMPDRRLVFTAIKDEGTRVNGKRIQLAKDINRKRIGVSPRQIRENKFRLAIEGSSFSPIEVSALTPKVCAILAGEVDAAVYFPQEGQSATLWDYAAAVLLIREAGGRITSLCEGELPFSGEGVIHKKGWIAANSNEYHAHLLSCLKT